MKTSKIWKWIVNDKNLNLLYTCKGHIRSVECIDVYEDKFVTGSNDNMIKIWFMSNDNFINNQDNDEESDDDELKSKKNKKLKQIESSIKYPYTTLAGHNEAITDVCWLKDDQTQSSDNDIPDLASSSLDNTIKIWDTKNI